MENFIAVLRKTLDGLGETTPEVRAKVYDKARSTIAAKLAAIDPPPPAAIAERQKRTLEEAIARVEAGYPTHSTASDPLAELDNIFSSIDRKLNRSTNIWSVDMAPVTGRTEPAWQPPQPDPKTAPEAARPTTTPPSREGSLRIPASAPDRQLLPLEKQPVTTVSALKKASKVRRPPPPEPAISEGPKYELQGGKLAGSKQDLGSFSEASQKALHRRIQRSLAEAEPQLAKIENKFPEIVRAAREYSKLASSDTNEIDVNALFDVGGSLAAFSDAYREQNVDRTLSDPIEPQTAALLQNISRLHGAFIMGFAEGAELVRKSDEFMLDAQRLREIEGPGNNLLEVFATDRDLIEAKTLKQNIPVRDYVTHFGWSSSRTGYSAYIIVRNGLITMTKIIVGDLSVLGVMGGGLTVSTIFGDPNMEFIRHALPVLRDHSTSIIAFFNHSPELRAYMEWVIETLELDAEARNGRDG